MVVADYGARSRAEGVHQPTEAGGAAQVYFLAYSAKGPVQLPYRKVDQPARTLVAVDGATGGNDDLHWPQRDGLKWTHLAPVVVGSDVDGWPGRNACCGCRREGRDPRGEA